MNHPKCKIVLRIVGRKMAVLLLLTVSAAAFATLGDGNKSEGPKKSLLSNKTNNRPGSAFSLRSGYNFRGNQVIINNNTAPTRYIRLNTNVTMQKGKTTYVVSLKKRVGIGNVKIDLGNRQFQRN